MLENCSLNFSSATGGILLSLFIVLSSTVRIPLWLRDKRTLLLCINEGVVRWLSFGSSFAEFLFLPRVQLLLLNLLVAFFLSFFAYFRSLLISNIFLFLASSLQRIG